MRRSLDLHPLGDWTDDARELVVFPQDAYPDHAGPHDYTRAVLNAEPPPLERRRARARGPGSSLAISCLAAVLALGVVASVSAETWRGLTVASEHRCAPYDKKRDYPYRESRRHPPVQVRLGRIAGTLQVNDLHRVFSHRIRELNPDDWAPESDSSQG